MFVVVFVPAFGWCLLILFLGAIVKGCIDEHRKRKNGVPGATPFFATLPGIVLSAFLCIIFINCGIPWQPVAVVGIAYCVYVFHAAKKASSKS